MSKPHVYNLDVFSDGVVGQYVEKSAYDEKKSRAEENGERAEFWRRSFITQKDAANGLIEELEAKLKIAVEALDKIQTWTISDPAEGPELRARASCVYNETKRALAKLNAHEAVAEDKK